MLYEKDAHTPRPMASTTKLMTALLAMENAAPDQNVVVTREAILVEGSALGLREGDNISMLDLVMKDSVSLPPPASTREGIPPQRTTWPCWGRR